MASPEAKAVIESLEEHGAHPDMIQYVKEAERRNVTGVLSSLKHFETSDSEGGAEKIARLGSPFEVELYENGAMAALEHASEENRAILEDILQ